MRVMRIVVFHVLREALSYHLSWLKRASSKRVQVVEAANPTAQTSDMKQILFSILKLQSAAISVPSSGNPKSQGSMSVVAQSS